MTRQEMRDRAREFVDGNWRDLSPEQRLRIAVLLRPDLPLGIERREET